MKSLIFGLAAYAAAQSPAMADVRSDVEAIYLSMIKTGLARNFEYDGDAVRQAIAMYSPVKGIDSGLYFEWCFHSAGDSVADDYGTDDAKKWRVISRRVSYLALSYLALEDRGQTAPALSQLTDERMAAIVAVVDMKGAGVFDDFARPDLCRALTRIAVTKNEEG